VRNQVRRRLRAILVELDREVDEGLAPGTYLLTVRPDVTTLPYRDLADRVRSGCVAVAGAARAAP
jgi:RNase P protein component